MIGSLGGMSITGSFPVKRGLAEIIVRKNRHGERATADLVFIGETFTFRSQAQPWRAQQAPPEPAAGAPPGYAGEIEAIAQTAAVTTTDWVPVSGGTFETAAQAVNRATARSAAGQAPPGTDNDPF